MNQRITWHSLGGSLSRLPAGLRLLLLTFTVIIGLGYLAAVANVYYSHQLADGRPGMSLDDIRAVYGGLRVQDGGPGADGDGGGERPSRMLTMIRGAMRQYFESDEDFGILERWLAAGADAAALDAGEGRKTPRRVLIRNCLRCHAQSTQSDISRKAPFGADEFDLDAGMIARFTGAAPAAPATAASDAGAAGDATTPSSLPPQYDLPRLLLVSHQHMLAIPLFTLIIAGLFAMTRLPAGLRAVLTPLPMLATLLDFAGWYLARAWSGGALIIAVMGGVFGGLLGIQIVAVAIDLLRPAAPRG